MTDTKFNCLPTMIGSLPHKDPDKAAKTVTRHFRDIPAWPQLPQRAFEEGMIAQFSEGFPGVVITEEEKIYVNREQDIDGQLQRLYQAFLDSNAEDYALSPKYAAGFYRFLEMNPPALKAIKGQLSGPVTFGLALKDESGRAIIYDETLADAAVKLLALKARWQEKVLSKFNKNTIIFLDEPAMAAYGSSYVPLSEERVIGLLDEVFSGITGLKGIHCCGNTDWSALTKTAANIINFDTYGFAESLTLYPEAVKGFLEKGGAIAWGIVPTDEEKLATETAASLKDRLEEAIAPFTRKGVPFQEILAHSLITPSCGLGSASSDEAAERALEITAELSQKMTSRYL